MRLIREVNEWMHTAFGKNAELASWIFHSDRATVP